MGGIARRRALPPPLRPAVARNRARLRPARTRTRRHHPPTRRGLNRQRASAPPPQRSVPARRNRAATTARSEEHTSELKSLMRIAYAVFCLKKKNIRFNTYSKNNYRLTQSQY